MKNIILILLFTSFINAAICQINALTDNGKEVLLFGNGTWKYKNDTTIDLNINTDVDTLKTNPINFHKETNAVFLVKSNVFNIGTYINPQKWIFKPREENQTNPEYSFRSKDENGYAILITEKIHIPLKNLRDIALINAQKSNPDARIVKEEYRTINNVKVLCLELKSTVHGIAFTYLGYYYTNQHGTCQFVAYTFDSLYDETKNELEDLLNGFTVLPKAESPDKK